MNTLFYCFDKRDQLVSFICRDCIKHHLKRPERPDLIVDYQNVRRGECLDFLHNIVGPFYIKVLKSGAIRFVESVPKGKHIIEYLERIDYYGQDKMHYLTLMSPDHKPVCKCDIRTVCGYDRGPKMNIFLRRMWNGQTRVCSARS